MRIAVITDTHIAEVATAFNANGAAAVDWINAASVDLVVHLGDVTADGVHDPRQFETAKRILGRLIPPLRVIPGNHDIGDNPADVEPTGEPLVESRSLTVIRSAFGDDRWACGLAGWTLIGLDSQLFGRGDDMEGEQFGWLASTPAAASGPIGLFAHKPLFREGPSDGQVNPRYTPATARRRLLDMLAPHDLRFVVTGHVHQWRRTTVAGVDHVWAPPAAFLVPDVMQETIGEKTVGLLSIDLDSSSHEITKYSPPGMAPHDLADHAEVYPQLTALLASLRSKMAPP